MARLQPTEAIFTLAINGTLAEVRKAIVATTRREHAKVMATAPRPSGFRQRVDGVEGAPLEEVKRLVVIEYQRLDQVVQTAMEILFDLSPRLEGHYRAAHTIFLNGVAVSNLKSWAAGDEVAIANAMPYARKIELGKMKMRLPGTDHVYEQAAARLRGRFGNLVSVTFTFRAQIGGRGVNQALTASSRGAGRAATGAFERTLSPGAHNRAAVRYPTLLFRER